MLVNLKQVGFLVLFAFGILLFFCTLLYVNPEVIFRSLASEYKETKMLALGENQEPIDTYVAEDSRVVEVVDEAIDSVVSVVLVDEVPIIERERGIGPFGFPRSEFRVEGTQEERVGAGSGFIVSVDGLVVTNKHVVSRRDVKYTVVTSKGKRYTAEVVARAPFIDIALLKIISDEAFEPLMLGASRKLELGQKVIAVGNALGRFQNTVSVGVVSGLSRSIVARGQMGIERLEEVIQTDAAINPGNSGGPLLALSGKVVGVNVATARDSDNISFAIPSDMVADIVRSVRKTGEIRRPFLGVRYIPVFRLPETEAVEVDHGALIFSGVPGTLAVLPGSPADRAGLRAGDVILAVDGQKVTAREQLDFLLRMKKTGEAVELLISRGGEKKEVDVVLEEISNARFGQ